MSFKRLLIALALALGLGAAAHAAPLSAYGGLPTIEATAVSPNGRYVAVVTAGAKGHELTFVEVATGRSASKGNVATADVKVRDLRWAGDGHLLVTTSITDRVIELDAPKSEFLIGYSLDLGTMKLSQLVPEAKGTTNLSSLASMPVVRMVDGKPTIFIQAGIVGSTGSLGLFRVDPTTLRSVLVHPGEANTADWIVGPDGRVVAQEIYDERDARWSLKLRLDGGWREVGSVSAKVDRPYALGLGRDGRSVLYVTAGDAPAWREIGLDTPETTILEGDPSPIFDPADGRLIGHSALVGEDVRYTFYDPRDAATWASVLRAFPGNTIWLVSWSSDHRKVVVLADSPVEGPAYAVIDLETKRATWLGPQYAELTEVDIFPRSVLKFAARDGLQLTGYLTLPKRTPSTSLPLIVFPHGGPAARDTPGFDWWAQAMASRGYAVLQVNFRGSDGLGPSLLEAGYGQWGRKMQTDLSDGVRDLADRGIVDPKRVCIVGASYGGYAALAGAAFEADVYRCAASVAGLSDLRRFISWAGDRNGRSVYRYWARFMGVKTSNDPALATISPIENVEKIRAPILLIHGQDDTVVPIEQSRMMAEALTRAGKPVEFLVQKGEDHWLSRGDSRLQMLTATMAFVEKHNPPN